MSIMCMMEVWSSSKASGNDRLVLLAIADEADDDGTNAYPSVRRLASKVNCHPETITECTKRLETLGELSVQRPEKQGRGRYNRYRVLVGKYGNHPPSFNGSIYGSVEGSVRMDPHQNEGRSVPKAPAIRTKESTGQRFQPPRKGCGSCDGGWILDAAGNARSCGCEADVHSA